jgi:hypothetical protein
MNDAQHVNVWQDFMRFVEDFLESVNASNGGTDNDFSEKSCRTRLENDLQTKDQGTRESSCRST